MTSRSRESNRALPAPRLGGPDQAALHERAHRLIPGGAHTYAKGDDQFPAEAPAVLVRGRGCRVWDTDGNEFVEYGMGLRSVSLGHAYPPVVEAVTRALQHGTNFTRPALVELEAAEALLSAVGPEAMVKFCKDGSTATTAAVRLARAVTGRDHPFFAYNDWFMGTTAMSAGIPRAVTDLSLTYRYNDIASLEALFEAHPEAIAGVILEVERTQPPRDGFLDGVAALCAEHGALFILDESITGFRWHLGGGQAVYGLSPDLSIFGKAMANGFAASALVGRPEVMERGGFHHEHERVFVLSTTHGAEAHALAAVIATIGVYSENDVIGALHRAGASLRLGVQAAARAVGVDEHVRVLDRDSNLSFETRDADGVPSQLFRTLFMQEFVARGVLAPSFVVSYSHEPDVIDLTVEIVHDALQVYARALRDGVDRYLRGPSVKPVMRPFA